MAARVARRLKYRPLSAAHPQFRGVAVEAEARGPRHGSRAGELPADAERIVCVAARARCCAAFGAPPGQQAGIEGQPAAGVDLQCTASAGQRAQRSAVLLIVVCTAVLVLPSRPVPGRVVDVTRELPSEWPPEAFTVMPRRRLTTAEAAGVRIGARVDTSGKKE
jgi:hypothetical protein